MSRTCPDPQHPWWRWAWRRWVRWPQALRVQWCDLADQLERDGMPRPQAEFRAFEQLRPDRPAILPRGVA